MKLQTAALVFCAWTILGIGSLRGQQAFGSEFDLNKPIHLEGKVTNLDWANPHVSVDISVADINGGSRSWRAELTAPDNLVRAGVTRKTIRVGDTVVVDGFAARSGIPRVGSSSIIVKDSGMTVAIPPEAWHHSYAEWYDAARPAQMTGTLVSIDWVNPHPIVHFAVVMPDGRTAEWLAELPPLSILIRQGWKQSTLNPGDEIHVDGAFAKDGARKLLAKSVTLVATGGTALTSPRKLLD